MAAMSCVGNLPYHNRDLSVQGTHQGSNPALPVVCADNWNDVTAHRNMDTWLMDTWLAGTLWQDPHQCSEEDEKD